MACYLIKLKPVDPYFFGDENTLRINEENRYIVTSNVMPSASSIIGMLRYQLLKSNGLLEISGKYSDEQQEKCNALIGNGSYTVGELNSFGKIKSVSPLFLSDDDNRILIHTPLDHTGGSIYTPLKLSQTLQTSLGRIDLPSDFSAKKMMGDECFMRLCDKKIFDGEYGNSPVFSRVSKVGIGIKNRDYFKKIYCMLNKSLSFAVVAEIDDDAKIYSDICYMGREKSAFRLTVENTGNLDIEKEISAIIPSTRYYVFGDTFVSDALDYKALAIVKTDKTRILSTTKKDNKIVLNRGQKRYNVIKAGSVFCGCLPKQINVGETKADAEYGFNKIIKGEDFYEC